METKSSSSSLTDIVKFAIIIIAIIVPFRLFIAQPYIVEGSSMDPTFKDGDYLIVDQISNRFQEPGRGEVVIMRYPKDPSKFFIKRIMGLPGETIAIKNGDVYITENNEEAGKPIKIEESYIKFPKHDDFQMTLKEGEYFVMGDNRAGSSDSRSWGPLPEKNIIGRPFLRLLPVNKISIF